MNPADAFPDDWGMYYDQTWMYNTKRKKVVLVRARGQNAAGERGNYLITYDNAYERKATDVDPKDLICWWPRAGAYNAKSEAVFIGRRARRSMKKSTYDHYFIMWGGADVRMNQLMAKGPNFLTYEAACEVLNKAVMRSCAISADLILQRIQGEEKPDRFNVIYRGAMAGELIENQFRPVFDGTPASKRAELKLVQEGIPCI